MAPEQPGGTRITAFEPWFIATIAVGALVRIFFVFATAGTLDVDSWLVHTIALEKQGLISYYEGGPLIFNHPPPSALLVSTIGKIASATGVSFAALLRLPFAMIDLASVAMIVLLLGNTKRARQVGAIYWLHPLAIIFSSYHGNTDTAIAFFLLATTLLVTRNQALLAGAALGACLWIKIPGVLVAPVFLFVLPDLRARTQFCVAAGVTGLLGYAPALWLNADAVINAVFLYPGLNIHTSSGISSWGLRNLYPAIMSVPDWMRLGYIDFIEFSLGHNTLICVTPMVVFAWLRRNEREPLAIATTIASSYALFYGLTNFWAFQYFAWVIPFWLMSTRWFAVAASLFATVYIYGAYAWLCGDLLLLGPWDFIGKPDWPAWLLGARNVANLFFLGAGFYFLVAATRTEFARMRDKSRKTGDLI